MVPTYRDYDGLIAGRPVVGILARRRTYRNLVLLGLLFPVGLVNFVVLFTAITLGLVLVPLLVGVLILAFVLILVTWMAAGYAHLLGALIDQDIDCTGFSFGQSGFWAGLKTIATNPRPYLLLVCLFATFPLGIAAFVFLVVSLSIAGTLIAAPIAGPVPGIEYILVGPWVLDTPVEWAGASLVGLIALICTLWLVTVAGETLVRVAVFVLEYDSAGGEDTEAA